MLKKILLSLLVGLTVACSDNNNDDNDTPASPPSNNGGQGGGGGGAGAPAAPVPELVGIWTKPCTSGGSQGFRKDSIKIDPTTFQFGVQYDQDDNTCAGTPDLEARANFNYTLPAAYQAGANNNVDLTLNGMFAKLNSAAGAVAANVASFCGFNDWQAGVEKEITGRNCIEDLPIRGRQYYQIFRLQGTNQLFVGKLDTTHTGESPAQRPVELESQAFTK